MSTLNRTVLIAGALGLLMGRGFASAAGTGRTALSAEARATAFLERERISTSTPGISAAVARGGAIVWSAAVGVADLETGAPATPATVYNIGSVSKAVTAVAVTQLVERGKVKLEDPIQKYVPTFPDKGASITVWNLLTHTSGIRHYRVHDFPGPDWEENHHPYASLAEAIGIFKSDALLFPPGKYYFYSSYGVNLLQGVVESASGLGFEDYLRRDVWEPAGMTRTSLDVAGRAVAGRARGYETKDGERVPTGPVDVSYKYASGGMLSTAEDLVRLAVALNQGKLLGAAARARMWGPEVPVVRHFHEDGPPTVDKFQQGLEWRLVHRPGGRDFVYECGTFNGFNACLLDYVAEDLVVAMTYNAYAGGYRPAESLAALFRPEAAK